jgi:hypothetical protein
MVTARLDGRIQNSRFQIQEQKSLRAAKKLGNSSTEELKEGRGSGGLSWGACSHTLIHVRENPSKRVADLGCRSAAESDLRSNK